MLLYQSVQFRNKEEIFLDLHKIRDYDSVDDRLW